MTKEELKEKMDVLGQLLYDYDQEVQKFDKAHAEMMDRITDLKEEIKTEVLNGKESVMSEKLKVQFRNGAVKWKTDWLEGYSLNHPEILKYRSTGKPTVAFSMRDEGWEDGR